MAIRDADGRLITTQRQFHCHCERCRASLSPMAKRLKMGKLWQAGYGELQKDFRKRVRDWHSRSYRQR